MMHPKKLAIIKCQAHKKGKDFVIRGNNAADQYAKQASGCTTAIMAPSVLIQPQPQLADVERIQQQATHMKLVCGSTEEQHEMQMGFGVFTKAT